MFLAAFDGLTAERQRAVQACLAEWARHPHLAMVRGNVEAEVALSAAAFTRLLEAFADRLLGGEGGQKAWELACRAFQRAGALHPDPPEVLGRAVEEASYVALVNETHAGLGVDRSMAEALVNRAVVLGDALDAESARMLQRAQLGRYVIWATFDLDHPDRSPFHGYPDDRWYIANTLGLGGAGGAWRPSSLILVSYRRPSSLRVHRPTIGDAADYAWYRPHADASSPHGMTAPVDATAPPGAGMPEVVHEAIDGATLIFPLRRAS
jgi:hypothetical protein